MTHKVQWHHIFAAFLQELLAPVGIKVDFAVPISGRRGNKNRAERIKACIEKVAQDDCD